MTLKKTGNGKIGLYSKNGPKLHALIYNFDIDGHSLKHEHKEFLQAHVAPLLLLGGSTTVRGMASRTGSDKHNDDLSTKRAKEVVFHLMQATHHAARVFTYKGVGERDAESAGQSDDLEDEFYRAVSLVVTTERTPSRVPKKKEKPKPFPPKKMNWHDGTVLFRANVLDLWIVKKIIGSLFLSSGFCTPYTAWHLSASNLSITVPIKGKPPIWLGDIKAVGKKFSYNTEIFDPKIYWKDKSIWFDITGTTITITVRDGLPCTPSVNYQPLRGPGVTINGRNVIFKLKAGSAELGIVRGVGSIQNPTKHQPQNCA